MNRLLKGLSVSVCLLMILVCAIPAGAQVLNEKQISLALAAEAAVAAMQDCIARGFSVSVAVVDRSGITKVLIRDDGAGPGTPDGSRRKALTAVTFRSSTLLLSQRIAADPTVEGLRDFADVLILGGGLPIRSGTEVIGGIGVGGAPGADIDDQCAQVGINRISDRLN